ncbi:MAG: hypothetical protein ACREIA_21775, partial [Opitutaceae bacterium]
MLANPSTGVRSFDGWPFAWYIINQDGAQPNKITIRCDLRNLPDPTLVHVKYSMLERTGSAPDFAWTADEWYDDGATSLARDERSRSNGTESIAIKVPGGSAALQGSRTYSSVPWGEEITAETRGATNAVTTSFAFYDANDQSGNYGRLRSFTVTGGEWEACEYYDYGSGTAKLAGALHKRHRPFKDSDTAVPGNLGQHEGEVTTFEYQVDVFDRRTRPTLVETAVNGVVTARSSTTYSDSSANFSGHPSLWLVTATRQDSSADGATLTSVFKYFREDAGIYQMATDDFFRMQTHSI